MAKKLFGVFPVNGIFPEESGNFYSFTLLLFIQYSYMFRINAQLSKGHLEIKNVFEHIIFLHLCRF